MVDLSKMSAAEIIECISSTMRDIPKYRIPQYEEVQSDLIPKESVEWVPPVDPFVEFEKSDYGWAKKLGFGSYVKCEVRYFIDWSNLNFFGRGIFSDKGYG